MMKKTPFFAFSPFFIYVISIYTITIYKSKIFLFRVIHNCVTRRTLNFIPLD